MVKAKVKAKVKARVKARVKAGTETGAMHWTGRGQDRGQVPEAMTWTRTRTEASGQDKGQWSGLMPVAGKEGRGWGQDGKRSVSAKPACQRSGRLATAGTGTGMKPRTRTEPNWSRELRPGREMAMSEPNGRERDKKRPARKGSVLYDSQKLLLIHKTEMLYIDGLLHGLPLDF